MPTTWEWIEGFLDNSVRNRVEEAAVAITKVVDTGTIGTQEQQRK
jgi:hypothetical protein